MFDEADSSTKPINWLTGLLVVEIDPAIGFLHIQLRQIP
jgi:hypothetical protein